MHLWGRSRREQHLEGSRRDKLTGQGRVLALWESMWSPGLGEGGDIGAATRRCHDLLRCAPGDVVVRL